MTLGTTPDGVVRRTQIKRSPTRWVGELPDELAGGRFEGRPVQTNEITQVTDLPEV